MQAYLYPVANYYLYMVSRFLGKEPEKITHCDYMQCAFSDTLSPELMATVKRKLEPVLLAYLGGDKGFTQYVHSAGVALKQSIEWQAKKHQALLEEQQQWCEK